MPVLFVSLRRATDLAASDFSFRGAKSDPYVMFSVGRQERKSPCIKSNLNPVWNPPERYCFDVDDVSRAILGIKVFDYDALNRDDLLGALVLPLARFAPLAGQSFIEVFPLDVPSEFAKQNRRSTIELELCLKAQDDGAKTLSLWENETWSVGKGWVACDTSDRQQWSSEDDARSSAHFSEIAPPVPPHLESGGWEYCVQRGDAHGWVYASTFSGPWTAASSRLSFVRRRLWENHCKPVPKDDAKQGSVMF